jgi:indole-3-pyruvate monooxygenase
MHRTYEKDVLVIGAGFAGLSLAAALRSHGINNFTVLEQGSGVGAFWAGNYDRIRLHSPWHDLPHDGGLRKRYGMFLGRDDLLEYFRSYAVYHQLGPHLRFGERVRRVRRADARWQLETEHGLVTSRYLAVATSAFRTPIIPDIPGSDSFRGTLIHSRAYRNGTPFRGQRVLVVGSGNSAVEIALDLVENGAAEVHMWVRGPRHFLSLQTMRPMMRLLRFIGAEFADWAWDEGHRLTRVDPAFLPTLRKKDKVFSMFSQDFTRYGIQKPTEGPLTEMLVKGRVPVFDQGALPLIRQGKIKIIDGNAYPIRRLTTTGAQLGDAETAFDSVILATGFKPGLDEFLEDHPRLVAWDEQRRQHLPITDGRCRSTVEPTLFFPGFDLSATGGFSLGRWGWEVGQKIATIQPTTS